MKTRILHTRFWQDSFISTLSKVEKLLFVYLLTNDRVNITGIYELPDKYIKADLDITQPELDVAKKKFDGKIVFYNGWIKILQADKYNNYNGEKLDKARQRELLEAPTYLKDYTSTDTSIHPSMDTSNNHKSETINNNKGVVKGNYTTIEEVGETEFAEIAEKYKVPIPFVRSKYDDMILWKGQQPNSKKTQGRNWKLTLMNWVKRDAIKIIGESKKGGVTDARGVV